MGMNYCKTLPFVSVLYWYLVLRIKVEGIKKIEYKAILIKFTKINALGSLTNQRNERKISIK